MRVNCSRAHLTDSNEQRLQPAINRSQDSEHRQRASADLKFPRSPVRGLLISENESRKSGRILRSRRRRSCGADCAKWNPVKCRVNIFFFLWLEGKTKSEIELVPRRIGIYTLLRHWLRRKLLCSQTKWVIWFCFEGKNCYSMGRLNCNASKCYIIKENWTNINTVKRTRFFTKFIISRSSKNGRWSWSKGEFLSNIYLLRGKFISQPHS
jgi:hypothetical protein